MRNPFVWYSVVRRIATTFPNYLKTKTSLLKASESFVENVKSVNPAAQSLPRSYRALKKLGTKGYGKRKPLDLGAYTLLVIPVTTFGLGCWQIQRRQQKLEKIKQLDDSTRMEPVPLPLDLRELDKMEYAPVKVVGEFCHDEELIVKPRHRHDHYRVAGAETDPYGRMNEVGAQVITPFKIVDRHYKILIQRGWVPLDRLDPETRKDGQVKGIVELTGLVRRNEKRPKFVPENDPLEGEWNYRDVEMMARMRNSAPVYLEASADTTVSGGPIGGQTLVKLRNEHMSYIITWFSLSAFTSWMWYRRYFRPRPI